MYGGSSVTMTLRRLPDSNTFPFDTLLIGLVKFVIQTSLLSWGRFFRISLIFLFGFCRLRFSQLFIFRQFTDYRTDALSTVFAASFCAEYLKGGKNGSVESDLYILAYHLLFLSASKLLYVSTKVNINL